MVVKSVFRTLGTILFSKNLAMTASISDPYTELSTFSSVTSLPHTPPQHW